METNEQHKYVLKLQDSVARALTNKLWEVAREKSGEHLLFDPYQANECIKWVVIQDLA